MFIEDELNEIIDAIVEMRDVDYDQVESFKQRYSLRTVSEIKDSNRRDKICLICARIALKNQNKHEATRYYKQRKELDKRMFYAERIQDDEIRFPDRVENLEQCKDCEYRGICY